MSVKSGHVCDTDGAAVGALEWPPFADPGRAVQIDGSGEYGRVRSLWQCCGAVLVECLTPYGDGTTTTERYRLDSLTAPAWGDSYSVPCVGAAWSLHLPCGHINGEGCDCDTIAVEACRGDDARLVLRLVCSACGDVRPDADVMGEGVSLGARCEYVVCEGTYRDDDSHHADGSPNYASTAWDGPL